MTNKNVIVIGAGLGGLSAAISLATEGFQVSVFEKNDKPGGKCNLDKINGFTFDLGPSILTMPHIFKALFDRAGKNMADYVSFEEVLPHWRNFFEDGTTLDLTPDMALMEKELAKLPDDESHGFFQFLEYSRKLTKLTEDGYFKAGLDNFSELTRYYGPLKSILGFDVFRTMDQGVRRFIKNEKLVDIMNYFIKYVGSSPYDSPALMNLLPYIQFGYGLWYVKGGMHNLAKALEKLLNDLGGTIQYAAEVLEMKSNGTRVEGVQLAGGAFEKADVVVSNMEVIPA
ncbi:diapolycopene oxygenase, partial [bacterium F11]